MPRPRRHIAVDQGTLSAEQVASILGVTKTTLKNWLRTGKIPEPPRNPKNNYRVWKLSDVDALRSILREEDE